MAEINQIEDQGEYLLDKLGDSILTVEIANLELTIKVAPENVVKILTFMRDDVNCEYKQLMDVCGVDFPEREQRFDVVYHLLSMKQNTRARVTIQTDEATPVPSVCSVFNSAAWFEREAWDLYGIFFSGHPDLRRILTDYGFEGHPLRKDFPLAGKTSDMPDVAFSEPVPLEGGPFVTSPSSATTEKREPRSREMPQ